MNCGLEGHMRSICDKPAADTEFRYNQNREKAIKGADSKLDSIVDF
jgi:hypothetical protein